VLEQTVAGMLPLSPVLELSMSVFREAGNDEGSDVNWLPSRRSSVNEMKELKDGTGPVILFEERSRVWSDCEREVEFEKEFSGELSDWKDTIL
jgi:hypothetical protein